jgi:hypothetical protein
MMRCNLDSLRNKSKVTQANNIVSLDDGDTVQTVSVVPTSNKDFEEEFTE